MCVCVRKRKRERERRRRRDYRPQMTNEDPLGFLLTTKLKAQAKVTPQRFCHEANRVSLQKQEPHKSTGASGTSGSSNTPLGNGLTAPHTPAISYQCLCVWARQSTVREGANAQTQTQTHTHTHTHHHLLVTQLHKQYSCR